jgi:hypothetical protein
MNENKKPPRSWQAIAKDASTENDSKRLSDLAEELTKALAKDLAKKKTVRV